MQEFPQRLLEARRKAGFSQIDCAHLLEVSQSHISRMELGHAKPSVTDLAGASVLFGKTMEILVEPMLVERALVIRRGLYDLPEPQSNWLGRFVRHNNLEKLEARVSRIIDHYEQ